ncbi:kinesin-like protein KIF20B isoform X1 [Scyliorhinus canicula]|uniref:kinesin-like protein KIF20B isoform X1 n=2 Tax=Scyliorhinus canicula TaxID=7830 RepID=UPI0018F37808|nr:kinesin-like protein KIF20B isoform X1 [Scyliorhinus canicula]XP_038629167.1 kinesin-like protein KIF20B isoform X1 [Scyliorhinus canicula]XP_038629168.1 kinesin-like protein KIF20B isoform X1 [Scyliorhinus canicula]XP_038629169.1 kinesin-like protein KIF20B isoform X1 [Scyliorhinus canicula]
MEPELNSKLSFIQSQGMENDAQEMPTAEDFEAIRKDLMVELCQEENSNASHMAVPQKRSGSKDHMCVHLRVRPFTEAEVAQNESQDCVSIENSTSVILKQPQISLGSRYSDRGIGQIAQCFTFNHVYGPETKQVEVFGAVKPLIEDVLNGQNCLVFTYGVTNAGKTYTFQGPDNDMGILPRSLSVLFKSIEGRIYKNMNIKPQRCTDFSRLTEMQVKEEEAIKKSVLHLFKESDQYSESCRHSSLDASEGGSSLKSFGSLGDFSEELKHAERVAVTGADRIRFSVWVSFCEIYNEALYDLLDLASYKCQKRKALRFAQDAKGNTYVKDLRWIQVSSAEEAYKILKQGRKQQSIASTKINNLSSRSHCTFSVRILHVKNGGLHVTRVTEMSLCDLAGSERNTKTKNAGERLKEAGNINTSLLILGKCINALRHNQISKTHSHVPFRESKLTRYFQGFFSGRGKVCIIVNISQCASMYDETLNVLKFSAVAQKVLLNNLKLPPPLVSKRSARDLSLIINNAENESSFAKRQTISWDASLEDVAEVEEGDTETFNETEVKQKEEEEEEEDEEEDEEEGNIVISKNTYEKLLRCIQDLKNKLIEEKQEKVFLERNIREEVNQEMEKFMPQFENYLRERVKEENQLTEDRIEKRNQIFQTLVKACAAIDQNDNSVSEVSTEPDVTQETLVKTNVVRCIKSLEPDVAEIKKQAEMIHHHLTAAPESEGTIALLEANLTSVIQELKQTQEILKKKTAELHALEKLTEEEKLNEAFKNEKIQKLKDDLMLKDADLNEVKNLLASYEEQIKNCAVTIESIQETLAMGVTTEDMHVESVKHFSATSRKRTFENSYERNDQPPSKKGPNNKEAHNNCISLKTLEEKVKGMIKELFEKGNILTTLKGNMQSLDSQLALVKEDLENERISKERLSKQVEMLQLELAASAETIFKLTNNANQHSKFEKELNEQQLEKIKQLQLEIEIGRNEIKQKELQNEALKDEISELNYFQKESDLYVAELKNVKDVLEKASLKKITEIESLHKQLSAMRQELDNAKETVQKRDSGHFRKTIETLQKECEHIATVSSQKSQQIQDLEAKLEASNKQRADLQAECTDLKVNANLTRNLLEDKDAHSQQLKAKFEEAESKIQTLMQSKENIETFQKEIEDCQRKIKAQELEILKSEGNLTRSEEQLKEKNSIIADLQNNLKCTENKFHDLEKCVGDLKLQEIKFKEEVRQAQDDQHIIKELLSKKGEELGSKHLELDKLRKELSDGASRYERLTVELQRKDEEHGDLQEKYRDAKKQMQQVEKEISTKRDDEKTLRNKVQELERMKNQMIRDLETKEHMIQQFKTLCHNEADLRKKVEVLTITLDEKDTALRKLEMDLEEKNTLHQMKVQQGSNEDKSTQEASLMLSTDKKAEEAVHLFQTVSKELQIKERIIQDMKIALTEQDQTQAEQDEVLEAKLKEIEELNTELEKWKLCAKDSGKRCNTLEHSQLVKNASDGDNTQSGQFQKEIEVLKQQLVELEDEQKYNRKKWLTEKMVLIQQTKEAEDWRNKDLRKWAEEREHYSKLQLEMESIAAELIEKDKNLQKWREERDNLVKELEVKLGHLITSNKQKDEEIRKLEASSKGSLEESENVLDSSEVSTENGEKTSRFPKPQLEIQFTPLQPNKMSVKESSGNLITVKIPRSNKKRKSSALEESGMLSGCWKSNSTKKSSAAGTCKNIDVCENLKNAIVSRMIYNNPPTFPTPTMTSIAEKNVKGTPGQLRKQTSVSSLKSCQKKDGTLQKIGGLLQSSPTILQKKAKRLMETLSSPKHLEVEATCNNEARPKRSRRKLYKQDISSPVNFPSQPIIEMSEKESDHSIMKRRLRTRTAKITK